MFQLFDNCQLNIELNTVIDFIHFSGLKESTENSELNSNIQAVIGLDFGTTYSGFACCHVSNEESIYSYDSWSDNALLNFSDYGRGVTKMKTATVLYYNDYYSAGLYGRQDRWPVEFFKLYLGDTPDNLKPKLSVEYKKAITNYFRN